MRVGQCADPAGNVAEVKVFEYTGAKYLLITVTYKAKSATFTLTKNEIPEMIGAGDKVANSTTNVKPGDSEHFGTIPGRDSVLTFIRTNVKGKTHSALAVNAQGKTGIFLLTPKSWSELRTLLKQAERKL